MMPLHQEGERLDTLHAGKAGTSSLVIGSATPHLWIGLRIKQIGLELWIPFADVVQEPGVAGQVAGLEWLRESRRLLGHLDKMFNEVLSNAGLILRMCECY